MAGGPFAANVKCFHCGGVGDRFSKGMLRRSSSEATLFDSGLSLAPPLS
jgi:hypothetical protein